MDKVLFIGHYREKSGWGKAGRGYIHALRAAGYDVAARPIKLSNVHGPVDEVILKAEETPPVGARYCIQHLLPHHMEYSGDFEKCIGIVDLDSVNIKYSGWPERLRMMDGVWVPNTDSHYYLQPELDNLVDVVPHAFDMADYSRPYEPVQLPLPDGVVKFYTIADMNRRKNLAAIVKAFHLAFPTDYPVALVIKVSKHGASSQQVFEEVNNFCVKLKENLRLYGTPDQYHKEIIISDDVDDEAIYRLHTTCDVYVTASYGEAWCIPAFEAMAFGKPIIYSNIGGPKDYIDFHHNYPVSGKYEPVFGMMDTFDNLFTAREDWFNVSVRELASQMSLAFLNSGPREDNKSNAKRYSYENIGEILKRAL